MSLVYVNLLAEDYIAKSKKILPKKNWRKLEKYLTKEQKGE